MFDYHMHTEFSDDCNVSPDKMITAAIDAGLSEIAITDHLDPEYPDLEFPFQLDIQSYQNMLEEKQKQYCSKIKLKKGLELGIQHTVIDACNKITQSYDYDFIIGSFHTAEGKLLHVPDFFDGKKGIQIHYDFYTYVLECLTQFKNYCVVGHLNIVDRYLSYLRPEEQINPPQAMELIREVLKTIIYDGRGIELNTSSFRYQVPVLTPSLEILKAYKELGGEILTLGSDAHTPQYVAYEFDYCKEILESVGFSYLSTFDQRKPNFHKIQKI